MDAEVDHLDNVVGRPADQEQGNHHQNCLSGPFGPHRLLAFDPPDGTEHVVQSESVKCTYYYQGDNETQHGLVECVPVHILWPIQVNHTHVHVLFRDDFCVYHDWNAQKKAAHPHHNVDDDGPLNGSLFRRRMYNCNVPGEKTLKIVQSNAIQTLCMLFFIAHETIL